MIQFNCLQLHNDFMKIHRVLQPQWERCFFTCVGLVFQWFNLINECVPSAHLEVSSREDRLQVMSGRHRPGTTSDPWRPSWALKPGWGNQGHGLQTSLDQVNMDNYVNVTISTSTILQPWISLKFIAYSLTANYESFIVLWVFVKNVYSVKTTIVSSSTCSLH